MLKKIILLFIFTTITMGCGKDDICPEETLTTPKLVIVFKSDINQTISKTVTNLTVTTIIDNETVNIIKSVTTDSITITMNTAMDFTLFQLIKNNTNENEGNTDNLTFSYERENVYLNRACAFKAIYHNLVSELEVVENENWIKNITVNEFTVEDETKTHVTIYH